MTTDLALQLIEKEKHEKTGKLDLGNCGLTSFPDELFELTWLKELILCGDYWDFRINKMTYSQNSGPKNQITGPIPENFKSLKFLKSLFLRGFQQNSIDDASVLSNLIDLHYLDLSFNNIKDIEFLKQLFNIKFLDLSHNKIEDIHALQNLVKLSYLNLSFNNITNTGDLRLLVKLEHIDLSGNKITKCYFIENCNNLKHLNLRANEIKDIEFLKNQNSITYLSLSENSIIDIDSLSQLELLEGLELRANKIKDIGALGNLKKLRTLNLGNNEIESISPLKELVNLRSLAIGSNKITDFNSISNLINLQSLDAGSNEIKNIEFIVGLRNLTSLLLGSNSISDLSPLGEIDGLGSIEFSHNKIIDITALANLNKLSSVYLNYNEIEDLTPLQNLTSIRDLSVRDNYVEDIEPLQDMKTLISLDLSRNRIISAHCLKGLKKLERLNLNGNQIKDISFLSSLISLEELYLNNNYIEDISPTRGLGKLKKVVLGYNEIKNIDALKNLEKLEIIDLKDNPISSIRPLLYHIRKGVPISESWRDHGILLLNNPITEPPIQIVNQGNEAIINYFEQKANQGTERLFEAKLMLVGEPGAGKTSLQHKLFERNYPVPDKNQKSTPGVHIRPNWQFEVNDIQYHAHIWDFGGQHIQFMLHQFFLTPDCLYVLMAEKRKELANFDYWLNIIRILAQDSPVIILFNEINIDSVGSFIYDEKKYKELFPDLNMQKLDVNLAQIEDGRYDVLINNIRDRLTNLKHMGKEVPAKWIDINQILQGRKEERHIKISEYFKICVEHDLTKEEDQLYLLRYYHLIGTVLHFHDDDNLRDTIFLDPNWTIDAVYSILSNKEIENQKGIFSRNDLDDIWKQKQYKFDERTKLLQLMLKDNFELCYPLPNGTNQYIIPLLLPQAAPDYHWDYEDNLQYRFQYPFMPKGIVSRVIVRMNEYNDGDKMWNEGVVLIKNEVQAQIVEKTTSKEGLKIIEIRISGRAAQRKDFLAEIRAEINKIHRSSFPNLPYSEMIPCTCEKCSVSRNMAFYDYQDIESYISDGRSTIECRNSKKDISIAHLIGSVYDNTELELKLKRAMEEGKGTNIHLSNFGNAQSFSQSKTDVKNTTTTTVTVSQEIKQDIKSVIGEFKNLKDDIMEEVEIEVEDEKEKKRISNELNKTEKAFQELQHAAENGEKELETSTKSRLAQFIDNLGDKNSRINKAISFVENGTVKLQKLARYYNNFAPFFALPSVPPFLLGKND